MTPDQYFRFQFDDGTLLVDVVRPVSQFAGNDLVSDMSNQLKDCSEESVDAIIVDFEQIDYFGSMLLEALRILWRTTGVDSQRMKLCNVSSVGREILSLAKFDTLWEVCATRDDARQALCNKDQKPA